MSNNGWAILILFILVAFMAGCSIGDSNLALPGIGDPAAVSDDSGNRDATLCLGLWQVVINAQTGEIDAAKLRNPNASLNVLGFMEPPAMENLSIDFGSLLIEPAKKRVTVDVTLTHPLVTGKNLFDGYDVRGVVFGPDMLNPDGKTRWFNPREFDSIPFGYSDGLLGAADSFAGYQDIYNPFKYFVSGIDFDEDVSDFLSQPANLEKRGVFKEGDSVTRRYILSWKDSPPPVNFLVFNYAVYANYDFPAGEAPYDLDDFSISANSIEAIYGKVDLLSSNLFYNPVTGTGGGDISIEVEVFDWQGCPPDYSVSVGASDPELIDEAMCAFEYTTGPYSSVFSLTTEAYPKTSADLELMVICTEDVTYGDNYFMGLMPSVKTVYTKPIAIQFPFAVPVEEIEAGLNYGADGFLPGPLPITAMKDFCVIADGSPREGVYYYGLVTPPGNPSDLQGEAIYRYPLDYSGPGTVWYDIYNPFGNNDNELWGNPTDLGPIDMPEVRAGFIVSTSTSPSALMPYLHRDWAFWFNSLPMLQNGASSPQTDGILKWVDVGADYKMGITGNVYAIAITDELMEGAYPPVSTKVGFLCLRSPYTFPGSSLTNNNEMFEKDTVGNIDGKLDDDYTSRLGVDGSPHGTAHGTSNTVLYILESDPTPDVEVFEINRLWASNSAQTYAIKTIHGFSDPPTMPVDLECFPAYTLGFSTQWNWVAVLEDNGDGTWQVSMWEQNGAFVDRTSPKAGSPLNLDIDGASGDIHVWYEQGGELNWVILEYTQ
jgi:hypothetical protein